MSKYWKNNRITSFHVYKDQIELYSDHRNIIVVASQFEEKKKIVSFTFIPANIGQFTSHEDYRPDRESVKVLLEEVGFPVSNLPARGSWTHTRNHSIVKFSDPNSTFFNAFMAHGVDDGYFADTTQYAPVFGTPDYYEVLPEVFTISNIREVDHNTGFEFTVENVDPNDTDEYGVYIKPIHFGGAIKIGFTRTYEGGKIHTFPTDDYPLARLAEKLYVKARRHTPCRYTPWGEYFSPAENKEFNDKLLSAVKRAMDRSKAIEKPRVVTVMNDAVRKAKRESSPFAVLQKLKSFH